MSKEIRKLELWADSFHEGHWGCEELGKHLPVVRERYLRGFVPRFVYSLSDEVELEVTVYGSYNSWRSIPKPIAELLNWGKPDLIAYSPAHSEIIFAVEETAAVPTGNQAVQRFERIYGSARVGVAFWYLVGEYGVHLDQGIRRDSIWPTVACLKLTAIHGCPSITLHYSDRESPEDYAAGTGVESVFRMLAQFILRHFGLLPDSELLPGLKEQYLDMFHFIESQRSQITNYIPGIERLAGAKKDAIASHFASRAIGEEPSVEFRGLLRWGTTKTLPKDHRDSMEAQELIKADPFLPHIERLVSLDKAYTLSGRTGSRPQPRASVDRWIKEQAALYDVSGVREPPSFDMSVEDFPSSQTGLLHVTTAKNIVYLCDRWEDIASALETAYPRLGTVRALFPADDPVMVYVSNSMKPGRIFGDPFTGQITNFAIVFGRNMAGDVSRRIIAYYPHQVHSQLFNARGQLKANKGITLIKELVDLTVFNAGIAVCFAQDAVRLY